MVIGVDMVRMPIDVIFILSFHLMYPDCFVATLLAMAGSKVLYNVLAK
ncbi:MAG: hypothetical protein LBD80_04730 [Tannerella sp.]|jgi:hypothetical protein|nr:hypothetical protein [Tannerella sp.]